VRSKESSTEDHDHHRAPKESVWVERESKSEEGHHPVEWKSSGDVRSASEPALPTARHSTQQPDPDAGHDTHEPIEPSRRVTFEHAAQVRNSACFHFIRQYSVSQKESP